MEATFAGYPAARCGCVKKTSKQMLQLKWKLFISQFLVYILLFILGSLLQSGMWRPCSTMKIRATPKGNLGAPISSVMIGLQALGGREKGTGSGAGKPVFNLGKGHSLCLTFLICKMEIIRSCRVWGE